MSSVAFYFASGRAFFTGSICLLIAVWLVHWGGGRPFVRRLSRIGILLFAFVITAAATPLPVWFYAVWAGTLCTWAFTLWRTEATHSKWRIGTLAGFGVCTLCALTWELSYQWPPSVLDATNKRILVIGDSLSAADFTEGGEPWPGLLAKNCDCPVENLAFSGAQSRSAAKHVASVDFTGTLVVLEIGGNDLLGSVSAADFERDLRRLLEIVCREDNTVIMLELPLPPFYNRYGEVQRRLAARHHVTLIPKRYFADVLIGNAATIDGLHLSPAGQRAMCRIIEQRISLRPTRYPH